MEIKQHLTSELSEQYMFEKNIFKCVFHYEFHMNKFYQPTKLYGCDKLDGDILQDIPRK